MNVNVESHIYLDTDEEYQVVMHGYGHGGRDADGIVRRVHVMQDGSAVEYAYRIMNNGATTTANARPLFTTIDKLPQPVQAAARAAMTMDSERPTR